MSHHKRIFLPGAIAALCAFTIILGVVPTARAQQQVAEATRPITSPTYRITAEDVLDISVVGQNGFGVPGQSRTVTVLADGTADLPYIGEKKVIGLTLAELRKKLLPVVEKELLKPAITISVRAHYIRQINVFGILPAKGKLALRESWRIRDVIASAGGMPGDRYEFYQATLMRPRTGETIHLDLKKLLEEGDEKQNVLVEDNDILNIQPLTEAETQIQVVGQVLRAGPQILPRSASVLDVLQAAGGPAPRASLANANIKRGGKTITLDLRDYQKTGFTPTEKLQVGDTLVIPENTKEYLISGAVGRGGSVTFPEDEPLTLYKAIVQASVPAQGADLRYVRVTRKNPTGPDTSKIIDVDKMLKTGNFKGDIALEPDDSIYVPPYKKKGITLMDALGTASAVAGAIFLFDRIFK